MFGISKHGWIGVDLGAGAIKVAQLVRHRSRLELVDAALIRRDTLPPSEESSTSAATPAAEAILGGLSLAARIHGRRAVGVLSMRECDFHGLRVDQTSLSAEQLRRELSAAVPLNWNERTYDAWATDHATDVTHRNTANVGVISAATFGADRAAADLAEADLDCRSLDATPTTIARAMQLMVGKRDIPLAAIDWGFGRATFCAIRQGRPLYVRCLKKCEYSLITEQLAAAVGCSDAEALDLLQRHRISSSDQTDNLGKAIFAAIRPSLEQLKREVQRTLAYLKSHRPNVVPSGIVLFGAGATIQGTPDLLSNALGIEVRVWQPDASLLTLPGDLSVPVVLLAPAVAASMLAWQPKTREWK